MSDNTFRRGQLSLTNFANSVGYGHPTIAAAMHADIVTVAMHAVGLNKELGQDAAERLQRKALELPVIHARVLDNALRDLGYDV